MKNYTNIHSLDISMKTIFGFPYEQSTLALKRDRKRKGERTQENSSVEEKERYIWRAEGGG